LTAPAWLLVGLGSLAFLSLGRPDGVLGAAWPLGAALLPALIGAVAARHGMEAAGRMLLGTSVVVALAHEALRQSQASREPDALGAASQA
jgi:hypothetical protein